MAPEKSQPLPSATTGENSLPSDISSIPSWRDKALCRLGDPDALFVQGGAQNRAKTTCRPCPVRTECLSYALTKKVEFGVWGGMTERERRALLRRRSDVDDWWAVLSGARDEYEREQPAEEIREKKNPNKWAGYKEPKPVVIPNNGDEALHDASAFLAGVQTTDDRSMIDPYQGLEKKREGIQGPFGTVDPAAKIPILAQRDIAQEDTLSRKTQELWENVLADDGLGIAELPEEESELLLLKEPPAEAIASTPPKEKTLTARRRKKKEEFSLAGVIAKIQKRTPSIPFERFVSSYKLALARNEGEPPSEEQFYQLGAARELPISLASFLKVFGNYEEGVEQMTKLLALGETLAATGTRGDASELPLPKEKVNGTPLGAGINGVSSFGTAGKEQIHDKPEEELFEIDPSKDKKKAFAGMAAMDNSFGEQEAPSIPAVTAVAPETGGDGSGDDFFATLSEVYRADTPAAESRNPVTESDHKSEPEPDSDSQGFLYFLNDLVVTGEEAAESEPPLAAVKEPEVTQPAVEVVLLPVKEAAPAAPQPTIEPEPDVVVEEKKQLGPRTGTAEWFHSPEVTPRQVAEVIADTAGEVFGRGNELLSMQWDTIKGALLYKRRGETYEGMEAIEYGIAENVKTVAAALYLSADSQKFKFMSTLFYVHALSFGRQEGETQLNEFQEPIDEAFDALTEGGALTKIMREELQLLLYADLTHIDAKNMLTALANKNTEHQAKASYHQYLRSHPGGIKNAYFSAVFPSE